jgi:hypothetical protein
MSIASGSAISLEPSPRMRKKPPANSRPVVGRQPLAILDSEKFFANNALRVDEVIPRPVHAFVWTHGFRVQNMVIADGFRVRIG